MNLENLLIYLRNDSGSNITFGSTVIVPAESELIWDSVNFTTQPFNAFNNVLDNISVFNQNIFQNNLVMINGTTDLTVQQAFDLFAELRDGYTNYNSELFTLYDKSNFEVIQFGPNILDNGTPIGSRPKLNFIEGSNSNITVIDDSINNEIDITIGTTIPSLDGYVQQTRQVNAGTGLSGGGDLSANRTISLSPGLLDGYALTSNVTSITNNLQHQINFVEDTLDGYALRTRNINTGVGLVGGGNLTADRTISLQPGLFDGYTRNSTLDGYATLTYVNSQDNLIRTAIDGYARNTITISAGAGLSGGGNLTSNRNISIQQGLLDGYIKGNSIDGYATVVYVNTQDNNLQSQINFIEDTIDGYALRIRNISTGTGLTGGGNLISDRTISIQPGFLDGYARNISLDGYTPTSRQINTGTGLTGGGSLSSNRTISLSPGLLDGYISGVTVRENSGANIGTQPRLNFIEGSNVTLTITNDPGNNEVDITIAASGSGGSINLDGYVRGTTPSTDTAIAIYDGYDGYGIKNSFARISPVGVLTLDVQSATAPIILSEDSKGFLVDGLNSELLNGQDGSFYTNASNLNSGTLNTARFNDTSHGSRGGGSLHSDATISSSGFMSGLDKAKLNAISLDGYATDAEVTAALAVYVPNSRTITAGSGLIGGGDLSANRTISIQQGLLDGYIKGSAIDGYATITYVNTRDNNLQAQINFIEDTMDGYALSSRQIIAGTGLSGGGNLTSNRTISLQQGLLDGYARNSSLDGYILGVTVRENSGANIGTQPRLNFIEGSNVILTINNDAGNNEVDITISATGGGGGGSTDGYVYETRQILAGAGLSGGGDLSQDRTLSVQQGLLDGYIDGITIRTNTGSDIGTQPRLNFIEGSNITISATNDSGNSEVDITISSSGGSSGGDGSVTNRYPFTWTGSSIQISVDVAVDFGFTEGTFQVEVRHLLQEDGYGAVYWFQGLTGLRYDGTSTLESRPNFFPSSASWSSAGPTDGMLMDVIGATTVRFTVGVDAGFPTPASGVLYVKIIPLQT